jgi:malonyl-CoA O-methyltransferase
MYRCSPQILLPPKRRIARSFGRRATTYDRHAIIQSDLIKLLVERLAQHCPAAGRWIDLGCGTGFFAEECRKNGLPYRIIGLDIAFAPLIVCKKLRPASLKMVQADIDNLPFKEASFDAAVTSSTLQWFGDAHATVKNIAALLKPTGLLAFSIFVQGSFRELFLLQQQFGMPSPVHCLDAAEVIRTLQEAGFAAVAHETVTKTVHAPEAALLLKSISAMGGTASAGKYLNRGELMEFCRAYDNRFKTADGVPLTYRAIVGTCRKESRQ